MEIKNLQSNNNKESVPKIEYLNWKKINKIENSLIRIYT